MVRSSIIGTYGSFMWSPEKKKARFVKRQFFDTAGRRPHVDICRRTCFLQMPWASRASREERRDPYKGPSVGGYLGIVLGATLGI